MESRVGAAQSKADDQRRAMTTGLPVKRKYFRRRVPWRTDARLCGSRGEGTRLAGSCAHFAALPADKKGLETRRREYQLHRETVTHAERTA